MSARAMASTMAATGMTAPALAAHLAAWRRYHPWSLFRPLQLAPLLPDQLPYAQAQSLRRYLVADDEACALLSALPRLLRAAWGTVALPASVQAHVRALRRTWTAAKTACDLVRHLQDDELRHHRQLAWSTNPACRCTALASVRQSNEAACFTKGQEQARVSYLLTDHKASEQLVALRSLLIAERGDAGAVPPPIWEAVIAMAARRQEATNAADLVRALQIAELEFHRPLTWPADEWRSPLQIDGGRKPSLA